MLKFKTFPWANETFDEIETIEGTPRLYLTPDGTFPSMTSILKVLDDGGIDQWRKRVGEEVANKITSEAADRGNALHDYNEKYLQNILTRSEMVGQARTLFNRVKPYLDEIELVVATEVPLWSKRLEYAGRVDCLGVVKNKMMVIDHKNSRRPIDISHEFGRKKLMKYMAQTCGYANALDEMKGIVATHGCLIVGNHLTSNSHRFIFPLDGLYEELEIVANAYHTGLGVDKSAFFCNNKMEQLINTIEVD